MEIFEVIPVLPLISVAFIALSMVMYPNRPFSPTGVGLIIFNGELTAITARFEKLLLLYYADCLIVASLCAYVAFQWFCINKGVLPWKRKA